MGEFQRQEFTNQNQKPYTQFHRYVQNTFGADFYNWFFIQASYPYKNEEGKWAVDFKDMLYSFTFSTVAEGWKLTLLNSGVPFSQNIVEVPPDSEAEEMVLTFHALKAEMIVELDDYLMLQQFEAELRENRNIEVSKPGPELLLPNTLVTIADWECQLILAGIGAGLEASVAITRAKQVIHLQTTREGGEPGDLSLLDKCKFSIDQK